MSRFLLVRLGAFGDIVHAIPVAAALSRAFPSARIDWIVSAKHRELLDLVPIIDRRLVIKDRGDAGGGTSLIGAIRELRGTKYDVAFDLQGLLKSAVLARLSGAQRVVGFSSKYLRERLARPFYTDVYDPGGGGMYDPRERSHVVQMNLGLLTTIGVAVGPPEFPIERVDTEIARAMRERGVLVRALSGLPQDVPSMRAAEGHALRIGVGPWESMERLLDALREALACA